MKPWRSRKYLDKARDQSCINCGLVDETIVSAHLAMPGQSGMGQKCSDARIAHLCYRCHQAADHGVYRREYEVRQRWVLETAVRIHGLDAVVDAVVRAVETGELA